MHRWLRIAEVLYLIFGHLLDNRVITRVQLVLFVARISLGLQGVHGPSAWRFFYASTAALPDHSDVDMCPSVRPILPSLRCLSVVTDSSNQCTYLFSSTISCEIGSVKLLYHSPATQNDSGANPRTFPGLARTRLTVFTSSRIHH